MNSSPPVGAIAYGRSGIACTVIRVEADRIVMTCPDGIKNVPVNAIARWEMPPMTQPFQKGDRCGWVFDDDRLVIEKIREDGICWVYDLDKEKTMTTHINCLTRENP